MLEHPRPTLPSRQSPTCAGRTDFSLGTFTFVAPLLLPHHTAVPRARLRLGGE